MTDQLHRELWTSWASLLRSYAAAHGLGSEQHAVVEVSDDRITVRHGLHWIAFTHTAYENNGTPPVPFKLTEYGSAIVDGHEKEMDLAAEYLTRTLIHESV